MELTEFGPGGQLKLLHDIRAGRQFGLDELAAYLHRNTDLPEEIRGFLADLLDPNAKRQRGRPRKQSTHDANLSASARLIAKIQAGQRPSLPQLADYIRENNKIPKEIRTYIADRVDSRVNLKGGRPKKNDTERGTRVLVAAHRASELRRIRDANGKKAKILDCINQAAEEWACSAIELQKYFYRVYLADKGPPLLQLYKQFGLDHVEAMQATADRLGVARRTLSNHLPSPTPNISFGSHQSKKS